MQNSGGKPPGFIGATDAIRATVHLDLRACHAHRRVTSRDTLTRSLPLLKKSYRTVRLPQADQDSLSIERTRVTELFPLADLGSWSQKAVPMRDRPANYRDSRMRASLGLRSIVRSQPGRH